MAPKPRQTAFADMPGRTKTNPMNGPAQPAVSIIIPCRNEARFVDRCLQSVFAFDAVPGGFEVIVVDGMSSDGTREILERWQLEHDELRVLSNPAQIVPIAMNLGIQTARGELIVRLDMHAEYPCDYLAHCVETSNRSGADNVGGVFITLARDSSRQASLVQALTTHRFGVGNANFRLLPAEGPADTVPYGCYRREVFARIGWYDERLVRNQDYELNRRLLATGGLIWCNPRIQVHYYNQSSLRGLLRQALFTGQWNPWTWYVAPYSFAARHAIPGIFVAGLVGLIGLSSISKIGRILLSLAMLPYALLASGSAWQQARHYGWWMLPLLPFLFFAYHVAYGLGILRGVIDLALGRAPVQQGALPWPGAPSLRLDPQGIAHRSPRQEVLP